MRRFKNKHLLLTLGMWLVAGGCLFLASILSKIILFRDLMLNIAASFLVMPPTVFLVNWVIDRRWIKAKQVARSSALELYDMYLRHIVMIWGYMDGAGDPDQLIRGLGAAKRKKYAKVIRAKCLKYSPSEAGHGLDKGMWYLLKENTSAMSGKMLQRLSPYATLIDPLLYGRLLELDAANEKLTYMLSLEDGALSGDWQEFRNKFASEEWARHNYDRLCHDITKALHNLLVSLDEVSVSLGQFSTGSK